MNIVNAILIQGKGNNSDSPLIHYNSYGNLNTCITINEPMKGGDYHGKTHQRKTGVIAVADAADASWLNKLRRVLHTGIADCGRTGCFDH